MTLLVTEPASPSAVGTLFVNVAGELVALNPGNKLQLWTLGKESNVSVMVELRHSHVCSLVIASVVGAGASRGEQQW